MSTKYKDPKEVPTTVLVARLKELADAVASGNFSELRMRIPAEVDRDADIVLAEVAKRLEAANDICVFTGKPINEVLDDIGREVAAENEAKLLSELTETYRKLQNLGWQDAIYCPKDGSVFLAIEAGSTGIHECTYDGKWPDGKWWIHEEFDMFPSKPILWKPKP